MHTTLFVYRYGGVRVCSLYMYQHNKEYTSSTPSPTPQNSLSPSLRASSHAHPILPPSLLPFYPFIPPCTCPEIVTGKRPPAYLLYTTGKGDYPTAGGMAGRIRGISTVFFMAVLLGRPAVIKHVYVSVCLPGKPDAHCIKTEYCWC